MKQVKNKLVLKKKVKLIAGYLYLCLYPELGIQFYMRKYNFMSEKVGRIICLILILIQGELFALLLLGSNINEAI